MKTYYVRDNVKKLYKLIGGTFLFIALISFVFQIAHFRMMLLNDMFYFGSFWLSFMLIRRAKKCKLTINDESIYFFNGLFDEKHILINQIEKIEYNPEIRIRVYMKNSKQIYKIPNIFSKVDTNEIFCRIKRNNKVKIERIEKPSKYIHLEKKSNS